MRVGSLFAGIGGFDLAARWMGWTTVWYSEIDPYACRVMEKNFPGVPNLGDITQIRAANVSEHPEVLAGGFPCQDISQASTRDERKGVSGEQSGLWREFHRLVAAFRPAWVVVENVEALRYRDRGLGVVLGDLASIGYDAEWAVLPASYAGAPHKRARLWLVAYPNCDGQPKLCVDAEARILSRVYSTVRKWPDPPRGLRVDDGVRCRMDRNRCLGNAVVPHVAYQIFRAIEAHGSAV